MGLVAAKCTQCGANIEVDASKEAGVCSHCGTAFITEKVINNYTIHNHNTVNNNIAHATINVKKGDDIDECVKRYRGLVKQKKFRAAVKLLDKMYDDFTDGIVYCCKADLILTLPGYETWVDPDKQYAKHEKLDIGGYALDMGFFSDSDGGGYNVKDITSVLDLFESKSDDEFRAAFKKIKSRDNRKKSLEERLYLGMILDSVFFKEDASKIYSSLGCYELSRKLDYGQKSYGDVELESNYDSELAAAQTAMDSAEEFLTDAEREKYADFIDGIREKQAAMSDMNDRQKKAVKRMADLADVIYNDNKRRFQWRERPNVPTIGETVKKTVKRVIIFGIVVAAAVGVYLLVKKFV